MWGYAAVCASKPSGLLVISVNQGNEYPLLHTTTPLLVMRLRVVFTLVFLRETLSALHFYTRSCSVLRENADTKVIASDAYFVLNPELRREKGHVWRDGLEMFIIDYSSVKCAYCA